MKITVGSQPAEGLDSTQLDPQERQQVGKLLEERARLQVQLKLLEQDLHLLLLHARDRRGLVGQVDVDTETWALVARASSEQE
jgi:hypothetical protein